MRTNEHAGLRLLFLAAAACAAFLLAPSAASAQRSFKQRDCLECHKKEAARFDGMKSLHTAVKQRKCEECHLRHGVVPKLVLKEQGNALCFTCHKKESIGLDKTFVHAVLRGGACSVCHDPHGSNAEHMLKVGGAEACFECHDQKAFQRKVVHAPVKDGCGACHLGPRLRSEEPPRRRRGEALLEVPRSVERGPSRRPTATTRWRARPPARSATTRTPRTQPKLLKGSVHAVLDRLRLLPRRADAPRSRSPCRRPARSSARAATTRPGSPPAAKVEHAPFKRGECVSCHDPHASDGKKLTRAEGNALCTGLPQGHGREGREAAQAGHHGSRLRLLPQAARRQAEGAPRTDAAANCASCHAKIDGAGQEEDGPPPFAQGACVSCHNPHGSNFPGHGQGARGRHLLRLPPGRRVEVREDLHPQAGAGGALLRPATPPTPRTTRTCSRPTGAKLCPAATRPWSAPAAQGGSNHQPVADGDCLTCHDPHGSNARGLLVSDQKEHLPPVPRQDRGGPKGAKSVHAAFAAGDCTAVPRPAQAPA